jgi:hypothetical protein
MLLDASHGSLALRLRQYIGDGETRRRDVFYRRAGKSAPGYALRGIPRDTTMLIVSSIGEGQLRGQQRRIRYTYRQASL